MPQFTLRAVFIATAVCAGLVWLATLDPCFSVLFGATAAFLLMALVGDTLHRALEQGWSWLGSRKLGAASEPRGAALAAPSSSDSAPAAASIAPPETILAARARPLTSPSRSPTVNDPDQVLAEIRDTLQSLLVLYDQRTREAFEHNLAAHKKAEETYAHLQARQKTLMRLWSLGLVLLGATCALLFLRALQ